MAETHSTQNPELRQAASNCRVSLPSDISVDLASMQEKVNMAQRIIDTTDTAALESSLDTVEKIKALRNKFSLGD